MLIKKLILIKFFIFILQIITVKSANITNITFITDLIDNLNKIHHYQNFIIFRNNFQRKTKNIENIDDFEKSIIQNFNKPLMLLSNNNYYELRNYINHQSLSIIFLTNTNDLTVIDVMDSSLRGIHKIHCLIILLLNHIRLSKVYFIFDLFWQKKFINTIAYFSKNNNYQIFTYNPFPNFILENLTYNYENFNFHKLFFNKIKNVNGYEIRTPIRLDPPRVFKIYDKNLKNFSISGIAGSIYDGYCKYINATLKEIKDITTTISINHDQMLNLILKNKMHIGIHPYGNYNRDVISLSYPIIPINWCLIVPVISKIPNYLYLILPFRKYIWYSIILSIFLFTIIKNCIYDKLLLKLNQVNTKNNYKRIDFSLSLCYIICSLMYIQLPQNKSLKFNWKFFIFYGQIFLLGFILSNIFLATLLSYLTSTVYGKQLNTVKDLINANMKIMLLDYDLDTFLKSRNITSDFYDLLIPVDSDTIQSHLLKLNTSYSYSISSDRWEFFLKKQKFLKNKKLRLSPICLGTYMLSFPLQYDSPFLESLNQYILNVINVGLYNYWADTVFDEALQENIIEYEHDNDKILNKPLNLEHLRLVWIIWLCGLFISTISFCLELLKNYLNLHLPI